VQRIVHTSWPDPGLYPLPLMSSPAPTWDMKWDTASAKYRRAIAQALASATVVMVAGTRGKPDSRSLRRALINWGYNTKQRAADWRNMSFVGWQVRGYPPL
jgi:hypothetical protein